ncbi:MAG: exonuclease SbcCD subunit D [Acidimicrobiales bacterium]
MRFLHTSDWHLGRTFHGASLLDEQRLVVDRLVELTAEARVDVVLVAGDLFDRAIPPTEAVALLDDALVRLRGTGARVVAIAGNHDSATRLSVNDRLLEEAGVAVRGDVARVVEPIVIDPTDGGAPVAIYPLPYLEPTVAGPVLAALAGRDGDGGGPAAPEGSTDAVDDVPVGRLSHQAVARLALDRVRAQAATLGPVRTVVVAHTFVAGGWQCASERDLSVGSVELVHTSTFDGIDYVALGHLHRDQAWDGDRIAYAGSPLPYSFSEEGAAKSVRLVELAADGTVHAEVVPLGVGRAVRTLTGTIDELLGGDAYAGATADRLRIVLTDRDQPMQAMARLQQRFPHAVVLEHQPDGVAAVPIGSVAGTVRAARSPLELAQAFWGDQHGTAADAAQTAVLTEAFAAVAGAVEP